MADAVTAMTGMVFIMGSARSCLRAVIPSIPGSWMSIAITAFTAWGHAAVWWPLYFRGYRMSSTAVIAFLFIPFYALGALAVGLLVGYVISFGCLRFSSRGVAMGVVDTPAPVDWKIFLFLSNFFVGDYWYVGWAVVLIGAILVTIRLSPK